MISLAISVVISTGLVALFLWLGSLILPRLPASDRAFWIAASLSCPNCKKPYEGQSFIGTFCVLSEPPSEGGAEFRCLECLEIASFVQDSNRAQLVGMERQQRLCETCKDSFLGNLDTRCPTCGSTASRLAP